MSIETSHTIKRRDTPYKSRRSTIYGPFALSRNRVISADGWSPETRLLHENALLRRHRRAVLFSRINGASKTRFDLPRCILVSPNPLSDYSRTSKMQSAHTVVYAQYNLYIIYQTVFPEHTSPWLLREYR